MRRKYPTEQRVVTTRGSDQLKRRKEGKNRKFVVCVSTSRGSVEITGYGVWILISLIMFISEISFYEKRIQHYYHDCNISVIYKIRIYS
jgi:hypothetical protein